MFQIIDTQNNHLPVKSKFLTAGSALKWAKKNLEPGSCLQWGQISMFTRYFIQKY